MQTRLVSWSHSSSNPLASYTCERCPQNTGISAHLVFPTQTQACRAQPPKCRMELSLQLIAPALKVELVSCALPPTLQTSKCMKRSRNKHCITWICSALHYKTCSSKLVILGSLRDPLKGAAGCNVSRVRSINMMHKINPEISNRNPWCEKPSDLLRSFPVLCNKIMALLFFGCQNN